MAHQASNVNKLTENSKLLRREKLSFFFLPEKVKWTTAIVILGVILHISATFTQNEIAHLINSKWVLRRHHENLRVIWTFLMLIQIK